MKPSVGVYSRDPRRPGRDTPSDSFGFVASLIVVSIATYASTAVLTNESSYVHSFVTALLTSAVWFGVTYLTGGTFVVAGPILAVVAYVRVVNWRYPGGWIRASP